MYLGKDSDRKPEEVSLGMHDEEGGFSCQGHHGRRHKGVFVLSVRVKRAGDLNAIWTARDLVDRILAERQADIRVWSLNRALHFIFSRQRNSSGTPCLVSSLLTHFTADLDQKQSFALSSPGRRNT